MAISPLRYAHCVYPSPARHRPKVPFHPRVQAPPDLVERSLEIHHLDKELDRFILRAHDYFDLVTEAFSSNIHYSSKLEGNPLPLEEVRRLTRNSFEGASLRKPDAPRQEIINHLLVWVDPKMLAAPWGLDTLRGVHAMLMSGVEEESRPGSLRTEDSLVTGPGGEGHFVTAPPDAINHELDSLLEWLNRTAPGLLPEVAAALFFHEFESIHPFIDGNGRTGRTLYHAYLQNHGLRNSSLCKVEASLTGNPDLYYRILGWTDSTGNYLELLDYFTQALLDSYKEAVDRFRQKDMLSGALDENAMRLLVRAKGHREWFSVGEAVPWIPGRGDQTVRKILNSLVEEGALEAVGQTMGKRYRFSDPLAAYRKDARARRPTIQSVLEGVESAPRVAPRAPPRRKPRKK